MPQKIKSLPKFQIGSDIEYLFIRRGEPIHASSAVAAEYHGNVGYDHGGKVGEIRAAPSSDNNIEIHIKNIESTIRTIVEGGRLREGVEINASHKQSYPPCGGHIHFSIKSSNEIEKCLYNLNYWLALTVQPLFPKQVFLTRVKSSDYGLLSNHRTQPHGFEYRTLPSFLFDKEITQGIIALAYAIVQLTLINQLKIRKEAHDLEWIEKVNHWYYNYNTWKLKDIREQNIRTILKKGQLGGLLKYIYPLFEAIKENRKYSGDIAEGWKMDYNYYVFNSGDQNQYPTIYADATESQNIQFPPVVPRPSAVPSIQRAQSIRTDSRPGTTESSQTTSNW